MTLDEQKLVDNLEKELFKLERLNKNKVVEVSGIGLELACTLKISYESVYNVTGPARDEDNAGKYVMAFSAKEEVN